MTPMRAVSPDVEVDGAELLDELHTMLTTYVVFPSTHAADAVALWIAATHGQKAWEHAPRLAVVSPVKRCGKSRLIDVADATARRSLVTVNASPAAVCRSITDDPPTLMIDEADTIFGPRSADNHEDLRGIVNAGHQRNRPYLRYDVTSRSVESFPTFAMAMLASIGTLPDTIMDRAIVVRMRRRGRDEKVAPFRTRRDRPPLMLLRNRLEEWAQANLKELTAAVPLMPVEDRAADTWEPLVAIADLAGGTWPDRARTAVLKLVAAENEADADATLASRLIADVKELFESFGASFVSSQDLVMRLRKLEESPWKDLDLSTRGLADFLRPFGVRPGRDTTGSARGYRLADLLDPFARYVPPPRQEPSNRQNPRSASDASEPFDTSKRQAPTKRQTLTSQLDGLTGSDAPMADAEKGRPW